MTIAYFNIIDFLYNSYLLYKTNAVGHFQFKKWTIIKYKVIL